MDKSINRGIDEAVEMNNGGREVIGECIDEQVDEDRIDGCRNILWFSKRF